MRICIYKTDEAPDLTLLLREGSVVPDYSKVAKWLYLKAVTEGEVRGDLLNQIELSGYLIVRLGLNRVHGSRDGLSENAMPVGRFGYLGKLILRRALARSSGP